MEDIISQGGERRPPDRRRRLVAALALVAVATLVVVEHLPHAGPVRHRRHYFTAVQPARISFPVTIRVQEPATLPNGITGPTVIWVGTERLALTGPQASWFWPAQGHIRPITGFAAEQPGYEFTRLGGGWVVVPAEVGSPSPGSAAPVFYLPDGVRTAKLLAVANQVAPAETSNTLWLVIYPAHADPTMAVGVARQYTTSGRPVGLPVPLPTGYELLRGAKGGLLLQPVAPSASGTKILLWNPRTRRFTAASGSMAAAGAPTAA
ncbi:MAG TPA: hypothetical protein VFI65_16345 [Streptosporangiaceae bacterium]|nr:hypothetical protein [Streptosporangiaceae bacterium]